MHLCTKQHFFLCSTGFREKEKESLPVSQHCPFLALLVSFRPFSLKQPQTTSTLKQDRGSHEELNNVGVIRNLEFYMVTSIVFNTLKNKLRE